MVLLQLLWLKRDVSVRNFKALTVYFLEAEKKYGS